MWKITTDQFIGYIVVLVIVQLCLSVFAPGMYGFYVNIGFMVAYFGLIAFWLLGMAEDQQSAQVIEAFNTWNY